MRGFIFMFGDRMGLLEVFRFILIISKGILNFGGIVYMMLNLFILSKSKVLISLVLALKSKRKVI